MKTKLLALLLFAGSSMFAGTRIFFGIGVGGGYYGPAYAHGYYVPAPPPPPMYVRYARSAPGPGYTWINGYYYPVGARYHWRPGYWARPPYVGGRWIAPRYYGHRYYGGYWRR